MITRDGRSNLTMQEAIESYAPAELLAAYRETPRSVVRTRDPSLVRRTIGGHAVDAQVVTIDRRARGRAWQRILAWFFDFVACGEIVATGWRADRFGEGPPEEIAPELWAVGRSTANFDAVRSEVELCGQRWVGVRFHKSVAPQPNNSSAGAERRAEGLLREWVAEGRYRTRGEYVSALLRAVPVLSGRAAGRAWNRVALDHLDLSRAGRKRKPRQ